MMEKDIMEEYFITRKEWKAITSKKMPLLFILRDG